MAKSGTSAGTNARRRVEVPARAAPASRAAGATTAPTAPGHEAVLPRAERRHELSTYAGALAWLMDRVDIERMTPSRVSSDMLKLERMHALLRELDDPHLAIKTVHVAGTKGKGSTCEMAAAGLEGCGYTVGLYTSPHLLDVRERVRINRKPVGQADFTRLAQRVEQAVRRLDLSKFVEPSPPPAATAGASGASTAARNAMAMEPTFFELTTAMAFLYFAEQAVDIAVIEVGLGGRLDATNVVRPEVCAITNISRDHTQILGDTVEQIAAEKAGIMKPGVPVLTYQQTPGVLEVLRATAERVGCPLQVLGTDIELQQRFEDSKSHGALMRVGIATARNNFEHIAVPLRGEHQALNCGLALAIMDRLCERGFVCPEPRVTAGLASVSLPGRMEMVWKKPRVYIDGAHNTESIKALFKTLGTYVAYDSLVLIFGCAADKDYAGMLAEVALGADKVIFTKAAENARAADPRELARKFVELGKMAQVAPRLEDALALAQGAVARDDLVCIAGSFYLAGEAKKHFASLAAKRGG